MFRIFAVLKMLQRMKLNVLKRVVLLLMLLAAVPVWAQKLITYEAGMGTRDPSDADVWILYQRVRAVHEGMVLHADSALLNTVLNDFTAFGHIKIEISDTTTIYGDQLYYDGMTRVLDIWDDTVKLIDGKTILKSDHLQYDRYSSTAVYDSWGKTVNEDKCLTSRQGYYNSDTKVFDIYDSVILIDSNMRLETDTLTYNTNTHIARFWSPTHIYTDSATMYSEHGTYNTDLRYAHSMKASEVHNGEKHITCDTLHYYEETEFGKAIGNVVMWDTVNEIISTSRYAETSRENNTTFVTDSALVRFVSRDEEDTLAVPDTMYLHADSIFVVTDSARNLSLVQAYKHVKVFRGDAGQLHVHGVGLVAARQIHAGQEVGRAGRLGLGLALAGRLAEEAAEEAVDVVVQAGDAVEVGTKGGADGEAVGICKERHDNDLLYTNAKILYFCLSVEKRDCWFASIGKFKLWLMRKASFLLHP